MGATPRIVVVGSYMRDMFMGVDAFPRPGETRLGHGHFTAHGGKGSNQAIQAARCGAGVAMIAAVGDDGAGEVALRMWADERVDATGVAVRRGVPTGVAMILVDAAGENQIAVDAGANLTLTAGDVEASRAAIDDADMVVAQLEIPAPAVARAFAVARAAGVATLLNAAPAPAGPIAELLGLTDILVVNEVEAAALLGYPHGAAPDLSQLVDLGVATLVVTAGGDGACLFRPDVEPLRLPPPPVGAIVDTTGAGDAFVGAFAARWAQTRDPVSAVRWGLAAGSLACTARGAASSYRGLAEVREVADGAARPASGEPGQPQSTKG